MHFGPHPKASDALLPRLLPHCPASSQGRPPSLTPQAGTWYRLGGAAGGAKAVVIDCNDPEVVAHARPQYVHAERVGGHLLGDVFDEDVP